MKIEQSYVLGVIALVAVLATVYLAMNYIYVPIVAAGDTINVSYTGTFTNGTVFDSNVGKQPLVFTVGSGQLIKGFDSGVVGMRVNQEKTITVPANDAYGAINPALFVAVSTDLPAFANQTPKVGMIMRRSVNGQVQQGVVTAVNATNVTIDFNPPLAGQILIFKIKVLAIKKG